jgi:hypothetical protein
MLPEPDLTRKSRLEFHGSALKRVLPPSSRNGAGGRAANGVEPKVIKILKDALNEARRGEIAAAIVFARPNEDTCSGISAAPGGDMHYLVAAWDYLKREIIAATDN